MEFCGFQSLGDQHAELEPSVEAPELPVRVLIGTFAGKFRHKPVVVHVGRPWNFPQWDVVFDRV